MRPLRCLALLLLSAALPVAARATPLTIINGNFATPPVPGGFATYNGGSTAITGWTVTGNSVDLIGSYWQAPPLGGQSVDLDGNRPGGLSQMLATVAGDTYTIGFELSGNPDSGPATKILDVTAGSASRVYDYTIGANTHANMMYVKELFSFTATSGTTLLSFTSQDPSNSAYGPVIGNVAVVPEPVSAALLGSGLFALGLVRRRRG